MKAIANKIIPGLVIFITTAILGFLFQLLLLFGRVDAVEKTQAEYRIDHDAITTIKEKVVGIEKNTGDLKKYFEEYILKK